MSKFVVGQNGKVINIVNELPMDPDTILYWSVADDYVVNVGDPFDPKDWQVDNADYVLGQVGYNHENRIRAIVQAIRGITSTVTGAQAANAAGLPTTAQSGQITPAQFKNAVKGLLP